MKPVDIIVIIIIILVLVLAVYLNRRRRRTSTCCGDCSRCDRAERVLDRDRSHYPYEAEAEITGQTCQNCAVRVENALNSLDGVWATVRIDTGKARILMKSPIPEELIRSAVHQAGYGVGAFTLVRGER